MTANSVLMHSKARAPTNLRFMV